MQSSTDAFFDQLSTRRHEPLLKNASGSLRFDLVEGARVEHWYVTMRNGDVTVSHREDQADAIVRIDKETFNCMVSGTVNAMAATLRGELLPEGNLGLVMLFQRVFPSPPKIETSQPTGTGSDST